MGEAIELAWTGDFVSEEDWVVRHRLAAAHRLVAHCGWDARANPVAPLGPIAAPRQSHRQP